MRARLCVVVHTNVVARSSVTGNFKNFSHTVARAFHALTTTLTTTRGVTMARHSRRCRRRFRRRFRRRRRRRRVVVASTCDV